MSQARLQLERQDSGGVKYANFSNRALILLARKLIVDHERITVVSVVGAS